MEEETGDVFRKISTDASLAWDVCFKQVTLPCTASLRRSNVHPTPKCKMIPGFQTLKEILSVLFLKPINIAVSTTVSNAAA